MTDSLDPQLVFQRLVVGAGNRLAATAARRVAESPGRSYNPLVIYGSPGLGKTHLLAAVGHQALALEPELLVHYEGLESLMDRLSASIAAGTVDEFREAVGRMDLLLLDDLQHAAGKVRTQEELLRLVDALVQAGRQVVVAADRPPGEIPALDARLVSRLAAGLTVDVAPPDPETRAGILRQAVRERALALEEEVVTALSRLPIDNVRELQGALNRLLAAMEVENRPVSPGEVPLLLGVSEEVVPVEGDEFGDFLSDVSTAVASMVETAPWRRRLADAILRWGGEGVRTRRLEEALDADSAPDVDALLDAFSRDVLRLRQIARDLPQPPADPQLLRDPDRLAEAEALLEGARGAAEAPPPPPPAPVSVDEWFFDRERLAWDWMALDERILEEKR